MSRTFRSACSLAQTAMQAGPSTHTLLRPVVPSPTHLSRRTAFNLSNYIPSFFHRQKEEAQQRREKLKEAQAQGSGDAASQQSETSMQGKKQEEGLFDEVLEQAKDLEKKAKRGRITSQPKIHHASSGKKSISPKKLNLLARQIAGLPVDEAILQMQFSDKAAARFVKSNLVLARDHAIDYKGMDRSKLIVSRSFVNKEKYGQKKLDIKGRGKHGVMRRPYARIKYELVEGKSYEEKKEIEFKKKLSKMARSAGQVREDGKLGRKVVHSWHW